MVHTFTRPTFWLEFRLLSDGLEAAATRAMPLTVWHAAHTPVFHRFPDLPAELRLKVWEYLIVPRIVGIACLGQEDGASSVAAQREEVWGSRATVDSPIPVLLHVNRETRALALRHYELSFEWKVPRVLEATHPVPASSSSSSKRTTTSSPPRTWFNFDLDAVYLLGELEPCDSFGFNSPMAYFVPARTARRVRRAAVSFAALRYGETGGQQIFGALFHVVDRFLTPPPAPLANSNSNDGNGDGDNSNGGSGNGGVELLVCVNPRDEMTHAMMGNETSLVDRRRSRPRRRRRPPPTHHHDQQQQLSPNSSNLGSEPWMNVGPGILVEVGEGGDTVDIEDENQGQVGEEDEEEEREEEEKEESDNVVQQIWKTWYRGSLVKSPLASMRFSLIRECDLERHVYDSVVGVKQGRKGGWVTRP